MTAAALAAPTFAALGEPSRLRIVELLRAGPRAVGDIADALGLRQPQVSKHLRVLGEAGLVRVEPVARRRVYRLEQQRFAEIGDWLESFETLWETRLDALGALLESGAADAPAHPVPPTRPTQES
ncbi:ArsR/SmtB family transcription factor [Nocardioides bruguierae]|uniref:Metalloregulator ArsR/SmtB family transcription factor n=1 Tax=Nocardioides bruguierae TaxID=2945102 RepID=A0A9X2D9B8_9ACTN|nr:metalloregulator ArsR/SmtB family transcription factor [Nocardioides bruguierae]MCM0621678.1 metalloregulator ArsR/SmtB family transcription factor [Nocardioides bruguierae]